MENVLRHIEKKPRQTIEKMEVNEEEKTVVKWKTKKQ